RSAQTAEAGSDRITTAGSPYPSSVSTTSNSSAADQPKRGRQVGLVVIAQIATPNSTSTTSASTVPALTSQPPTAGDRPARRAAIPRRLIEINSIRPPPSARARPRSIQQGATSPVYAAGGES